MIREHGLDEVWLCPADPWMQRYATADGHALRSSGRWEFARPSRDTESRIILENYPEHWLHEGVRSGRAAERARARADETTVRYSSMVVERAGKRLRLVLDADLRRQYQNSGEQSVDECAQSLIPLVRTRFTLWEAGRSCVTALAGSFL